MCECSFLYLVRFMHSFHLLSVREISTKQFYCLHIVKLETAEKESEAQREDMQSLNDMYNDERTRHLEVGHESDIINMVDLRITNCTYIFSIQYKKGMPRISDLLYTYVAGPDIKLSIRLYLIAGFLDRISGFLVFFLMI